VSLLGIQLTLLIGPTVAVPAPPSMMEALQRVEVRHGDVGGSGFQLVFGAGRGGTTDVLDHGLLRNQLLRPFHRLILLVTLRGMPRVLMDGIITHQELSPSSRPGDSTLTITGEDVSVMMDLEERSTQHPAQDETVIANKIILSYAKYGMIPMVIPPPSIDTPLPTDRTPMQQGTDLQYLKEIAARHGYVFHVTPGPAPFTSTAYWGPPIRTGVPQRAISVDLGPETNAENVTFRNDGLAPVRVEGQVQDRMSNRTMPVQTFAGTRPPLATRSGLTGVHVRRRQLRESGLTTMQAFARAQGATDAASDAVTVQGELDALRYGDLLRARGLVGLRGAGLSFDGLYYVQQVTHAIRQGEYRQRFTLRREGLGSTTPAVIP
jgi:hypothetical protein